MNFQSQITKVTSNPIGAVVGGVAVFYATKKWANVSNKWMLGVAVLVGVVGGAMAQQAIVSQKPTAKTVK